MSPQYAEETAIFMATKGYAKETNVEERTDGAVLRFKAIYHNLKAHGQELVMEVLQYSDGGVRYFLEIVNYHGLSSFSFELDSWKYRDEYIEFSYYTNPETGTALTFKLQYPDFS